MSPEIYGKLQDKIALVFDFEINTPPENTNYRQWLALALAPRILQLLQHNTTFLMAALYRIDVAEEKIKKALNNYSLKDAAFTLAELVVERQVQKIEYQQKFKKN